MTKAGPVIGATWSAPTATESATVHRSRLVAWLPWCSLAALTGAALLLRLLALNWRLPYTMNVDEPVVMDQAAAIIRNGDLNPHRFVYPSLQIYLQAAIDWLHLQWGLATGRYQSLADLPINSHVITTAPGFYQWGRAGTAVLGALTVWLTGLAGRGLGGWSLGLPAALFLAVSPLHVGHSHFVTPDVPSAAMTSLALLTAVAILNQSPRLAPARRRNLYLLAGVAFGLATATKYNAVAIGVGLLLAHLLARPPRMWLADGNLWLAGLASLGAFFVVTPFALIDRKTFLEDIASIIYHYKWLGHVGFESDQNWWWYLNWLLRNEAWLIVPALVGILWAAIRQRPGDLLLLIVPLASYAGLAGYKVHFERNLLPLFPCLALLAARPLADLLPSLTARLPGLPHQRVARPALALLPLALASLALALPPASASVSSSLFLARTDSRLAAVTWLQQLPADARILADLEPELWQEDRRIQPAQFVTGLHEQPAEWFAANGYPYLVTNASRSDRFTRNPERYPAEAAAYARLYQETRELARFNLDSGHIGPEVRILQVTTSARHPTIGHPLTAQLGSIELLGATMTPVARLDEVAVVRPDRVGTFKAGGILGLTLFWQPAETLTEDYTVFVHLVDARGRILAQRDTPPQAGRYPTSQWRPREVVVDSANLPLPSSLAPGSYRVVVGLYRPTDGQRLPVLPANSSRPDSIELASIQVGR